MAKVMVIYHSGKGHTKALAEFVAEGARSVRGVEVEMVPAEHLDLSRAAEADGFAIGSPDYFSYVAGEVKAFFDKILYDTRFHGKLYVAFATYGGDEKTLGVLELLAAHCHLKEVVSGVQCHSDHVSQCAQAARALGKALADAIERRARSTHPAAAGTVDP